MDEDNIFVLDGSHGEGGGQILRNAVSYAALLEINIKVVNIRAGRSKPGLQAQHMTAIRLVAQASGGRLVGDVIGSQVIEYYWCGAQASSDSSSIIPRQDGAPRVFVGDTKTAASTMLLLQVVLPCALFLGSNDDDTLWILKGGTNALMAPQYEFWESILWPTLENKMTISSTFLRSKVIRRGYFPRGGGEVQLHCTGSARPSLPLNGFNLIERGDVSRITIRSFHGGQCPRHVAEKMATVAKELVESRYPSLPITTNICHDSPSSGSASGILLVAFTTTGLRLGGSALGSAKKSPSSVGMEAADELLSTLEDGGCVDEHLQDQLVLYMALAEGTSMISTGSLALHTRTAMWLAEQLCGVTFEVQGLLGPPDSNGRVAGKHTIQCQGIGFQPK
jgi:RNA 3'-terminal phosphate cyclase (ATP)